MLNILTYLSIPILFTFVMNGGTDHFENKEVIIASNFTEISDTSNHENFELKYHSNLANNTRPVNSYISLFDEIENEEATLSQVKYNSINTLQDETSIVYNTHTVNSYVSLFDEIENEEATLSQVKYNSINTLQDETLLNELNFNLKHQFSGKKRNFIETLLPLIAFQNQQIRLERDRLIKIMDYLTANKSLSKKDRSYLENISSQYYVNTKNRHKIDILNDLLLSVDVIPVSIVLAQAANESGWGSSRFAKEYNALFGQYTYDEKNGVIPLERTEGKKYLIRNFASIDQSIESYFKNINTHYAYKEFREVRQKLKNNSSIVNIKLLTQTLDVYAEDENYVNTINSIIRTNKLIQFDHNFNSFIKS